MRYHPRKRKIKTITLRIKFYLNLIYSFFADFFFAGFDNFGNKETVGIVSMWIESFGQGHVWVESILNKFFEASSSELDSCIYKLDAAFL